MAQLVVFDLDGTITRNDTAIQYVLGYLKTHPWRLVGLLLALPTVLLYLFGRANRGTLKASVVCAVLGGSTREQIERWTERWVRLLVERDVFQDALARIAAHRAAGDILVLMSGSLDVYVPVIGRDLGFTDVICTCLRWDGERLHGTLATANCRAEEKARHFESLRRRHPNMRSVAYGNEASDLLHLKLADRGILVNGDRLASREAERVHVVGESWT
jgi:phosphatidylglycerophosphatase C